MIISTVLRLMRGAAKASLKAGKFAIDTSGKLLKTGARAVKHSRMTPEERRKAKRKEKRKDKNKKAIKKTGETAVKATGHIISEGFILLVGIIEDIGVLMLIMLLILAIMLVTMISVLGGVFGVVMADNLEVTTTSTGTGLSYTSSGSSGKTAGSYQDYDWHGNRDKNMIKLTSQWDKDLYDLLDICVTLGQVENKGWDGNRAYFADLNFVATTAYESGIIKESSAENNYYKLVTGGRSDSLLYSLYNPSYDSGSKCTTPCGMMVSNTIGAKASDCEYAHFSADKIDSSMMSTGISKLASVSGQSVDKYSTYSCLNISGALCFTWRKSKSNELAPSGTTTNQLLTEILPKLDMEANKTNVAKILAEFNYACHLGHNWGQDRSNRVFTVLALMYKYGDENWDNWWVTDKNGNIDEKLLRFLPNHTCAGIAKDMKGFSGVDFKDKFTIHVIHNGKEELIEDGVLTHLKSFAEEHGLKDDYNKFIGLTIDTNGGYSSTGAIWYCALARLVGNTVLRYVVDKCGIVFSNGETSIDNSNFPGGTQTAKNVVAVLHQLYEEHGPDGTGKFWTAGSNDLLNGDGTANTNFSGYWCAMFVNTVLNKAKINGSDMTVAQGLRKKTNNSFPGSKVQTADMGYCTGTSSSHNLFHDTSGKSDSAFVTESGFVTAHYGGQAWGSEPVKDYKGNLSKETQYVPKAGDIITYYDGTYGFAHVGMCVEDGKSFNDVMTIEGNTGNGGGQIGYKNGAANAGSWGAKVSVYFEINYAALEEEFGTPSISTDKKTVSTGGSIFDLDSMAGDLYDKTKDYAYGGRSKNGVSSSKQAIVVNYSSGSSCTVTAFERNGAKWSCRTDMSAMDGHVGGSGIGNTSERDRMTPEGTYYLGKGFGIAQSGLKIDWTNVNDNQYCWGGSNSGNAHPNEMYAGSIANASTDEDLTAYCKSGSYKYSVFIEYNYGSNHHAGEGSAFFLHVGSKGTAGCVSVSEANMAKIVKWLDKSKKPIIIIHGSDFDINKYKA